MEPLECPFVEPSLNLLPEENPWVMVEGTPVKTSLETQDTSTCLDYHSSYSIDRDFQEGDTICDEGRVYFCDDTVLCDEVPPSATDVEYNPWILMRTKAQVIEPTEPVFAPEDPLETCVRDDL